MSVVTKKRAFLEAFKRTGSVVAAARIADVERGMHYRWIQSEKYRQQFEEAKEQAADALEDEAVRRAHLGVMEPVFYKGQMVKDANGNPTGIRRYSDGLMMFLLRGMRPDKYREKVSAEVTGKDGGPITLQILDELLRNDPAPPAGDDPRKPR